MNTLTQPLGNRVQAHPIKGSWQILFASNLQFLFFRVGVLQRLMCENPHGEAHGPWRVAAALSPAPAAGGVVGSGLPAEEARSGAA